MDSFCAYRLIFECKAVTPVILPRYNGSTLRGAFFGALRKEFCLNKNLNTCLNCAAAEACPICRLVATVERDNDRGVEIPRPFAIEPVISPGPGLISPDAHFSFGLTLFGHSLPLFPYAILAIQHMGETGMGNRTAGAGRFLLHEVKEINPLTGLAKLIFSNGSRVVNIPDLPITHRDVQEYSLTMNPDTVGLKLLTPLRLVVEGSLVRKLTFRVFMQRLLRRLTDLYGHYMPAFSSSGDGKENGGKEVSLNLDFPGLLKQAEQVQVVQDNTSWVDLSSYSRRRQAASPVGGLVGSIAFKGDMKEFLPFLVWGQFTHVGKDATKGNGWYEIKE